MSNKGKGKKGKKEAFDLDDYLKELEIDDTPQIDTKNNNKGSNSNQPSPSEPFNWDNVPNSLTGTNPTDCIGRMIGKKPEDHPVLTTEDGKTQTSPPTIPVSQFFTAAPLPIGELMDHPLEINTYRVSSAELREKEKLNEETLAEIREGAEAHRQARQDIQKFIRPGVKLIDIARQLESSSRKLIGKDGLKRGWAFPTGLSLNNIAAHWSPNSGDQTVLKQSDVLKVDFGVHVNGRIIDSAFTMHFDEKYDPLVEAVKEATNAGIRAAGIDVRLCDVGAAIEEVMTSYEMEINGKTTPIRCIQNLCGHNIEPYKIHGGKTVPIYDNRDQTKMEEMEVYAIETFGSNGRGRIVESGEVSHYMKNFDVKTAKARNANATRLYNVISREFSTLAFCRRWLDDIGEKNYLLALKSLVDAGSINSYPPLVEVAGSYTAQFEHTIVLRPTQKEVVTRGYDY